MPTRHAAVAVWGSAQAALQRPQLLGSLSVLAQYAPAPVPQVSSGAAQLDAQVPSAQS